MATAEIHSNLWKTDSADTVARLKGFTIDARLIETSLKEMEEILTQETVDGYSFIVNLIECLLVCVFTVMDRCYI